MGHVKFLLPKIWRRITVREWSPKDPLLPVSLTANGVFFRKPSGRTTARHRHNHTFYQPLLMLTTLLKHVVLIWRNRFELSYQENSDFLSVMSNMISLSTLDTLVEVYVIVTIVTKMLPARWRWKGSNVSTRSAENQHIDDLVCIFNRMKTKSHFPVS